MEYGIPIFYRSDKIVDIFPDEYLEDQGSSLFQEYIGDVEDGKVEFDGSVLIYSCLSGGVGSDIRSNTVYLYNAVSF